MKKTNYLLMIAFMSMTFIVSAQTEEFDKKIKKVDVIKSVPIEISKIDAPVQVDINKPIEISKIDNPVAVELNKPIEIKKTLDVPSDVITKYKYMQTFDHVHIQGPNQSLYAYNTVSDTYGSWIKLQAIYSFLGSQPKVYAEGWINTNAPGVIYVSFTFSQENEKEGKEKKAKKE